MMKAQLSLEMLVILAILSIYLAAVITLWSQSFAGLEAASASLALSDLSDELAFYSKLCANAPCSGKISYTVFPTVAVAVSASGKELTLSASAQHSAPPAPKTIVFSQPVDASLSLSGSGELAISSDGSRIKVSQ